MFLKSWRLLTVLLNALTMGMLFCHLLEMPQKMHYSAALYLHVTHTLYAFYGLAGGPIEVAGLICALVLCMMVRNRRPAMLLTCIATLFFAAALAMWFLFVDPANARFAQWTAASCRRIGCEPAINGSIRMHSTSA